MASPISDEQRARLLRAETHTLLQSPDFIRSPVMSQLLSYLVEEAISNPGNPPKAYQVAVDGLGRTEDFDVQADSYPRVQVGRLRKMLGTYYNAHHSATRLHIPIGHYAVEIATDDHTVRAEQNNAAPEAGPGDADRDSPPPVDPVRDRWFNNRLTLIGLSAILLIAAAGLIWLMNSSNPDASGPAMTSDNETLPPKIYIAASPAEAGVVGSDMSVEIQQFFEDAFARSSQVRLAAAGGPDIASVKGQNAYLFESKIVAGPSGPEIKFLLTSLIQNETIWSATIALPDSPADYPEKLGPISSRITSIYGLIATDQRKRLPDNAMIGYPCLLRFESYRANRDPDQLPVVESCIEKSLVADPFDSQILAAASFISFCAKRRRAGTPIPSKGWNMPAGRWFAVAKMHRQISRWPGRAFSTAIAFGERNSQKRPRHWTRMKQRFRPRPGPSCSRAATLTEPSILDGRSRSILAGHWLRKPLWC
ncbi:hypothetical protein C8024_00200 [Sphingopyxis sp. BSNA05]|uniref:hypothetical protein n=1 Tax=Sphingopyxis sp. BSNA05 TaxID=1236614 RepID=UPI0015679EDB|nr:hypothetical protein [Sphingopyxis sp. BSNA05]NRD88209.1 hypothetical protein [Sphingopyxis sp. BSNA05]